MPAWTPAVSFIGAGNLAWHLAPALDNAGYAVHEVYSRHARHAEQLTGRLYNARVVQSPDFSASSSNIFIICVTDDAIEAVVRELVLPENALLLHTSASQPRTVLEYAAPAATGVFYPLQTFSKSRKIHFASIPIFVEGDTPQTEKVLLTMGRALSREVHLLDAQQRLALHVAAVFAANFTNHLLHLAHEIMQQSGLKPEWLHPLVAETVNKAMELGPAAAQTGPASRGDLQTLDRHMDFLKNLPDQAAIYRIISQDILNRS
jgi:predicted short-subunit dehydrogenase-like oxidoreductase (DUF2520 family)